MRVKDIRSPGHRYEDPSSLSLEISMEGALVRMEQEALVIANGVKSMGAGMDLETVILNGDPGNKIITFAQENNVDLIVVGTQGKTGIERLFLGSVAENVIRNARSPVLVVRGQDR